MRVFVDTSSIVFALSNRKDPLAGIREGLPGCEIVIPSGVLGELKGIGSGTGKFAKHANAGLALISGAHVTVASSNGNVDDWLVGSVKPGEEAVCTNDMKLKERLKNKGITVFSISRTGALR